MLIFTLHPSTKELVLTFSTTHTTMPAPTSLFLLHRDTRRLRCWLQVWSKRPRQGAQPFFFDGDKNKIRHVDLETRKESYAIGVKETKKYYKIWSVSMRSRYAGTNEWRNTISNLKMIYLRYVDRGRDCLSEDSIGESIQATKNKREEGSLVNGRDEAPRDQR